MSAAARREAARYLQESYQVSERRAGRLLRLSNSGLRYCSRRPAAEDLRRRLRELAAGHPRYDERYSMDFMRDTLADGGVFRTLKIVDDYTRECLATEVDTGLPGLRVVRVPERLAAAGRRPLHIVVDNGPEFVSKAVDQWAAKSGVNLRFIDRGKPMRNGYIESFNGKFGDECLSRHRFVSPEEARSVSEEWRIDYHERHPRRSLQHRTPAEFAAKAGSKQPAELSL